MSNIYSFQSRVEDLGKAASHCPDLQQVATPYFEAAAWERETGKKVAQKVGTNGLVDMCAAVDRLTDFARNCQKCGVSGAICQFAGVERMTPEETLVIVDK